MYVVSGFQGNGAFVKGEKEQWAAKKRSVDNFKSGYFLPPIFKIQQYTVIAPTLQNLDRKLYNACTFFL